LDLKAKKESSGKHRDALLKLPVPGVLVADDESGVLQLLGKTLSRLDVHVRLANSGQEAVTIAEEITSGINLALLDINMPGLSGAALVKQLQQLCPGICILLMSGDQGICEDQELLDCHADELIIKPFSLEDIRCSVEQHLREMGLR
jgi:two-component system OmpR family response regulator